MSEPRIVGIELQRQAFVLRQPYRLSNCTLSAIESVLASVQWDDDTITLGEVTPLAGYHREDVREVLRLGSMRQDELINKTASEAREIALSLQQRSRCAASLLISAIDNRAFLSKQIRPLAAPVPLVAAVASNDPDLEERIAAALDSGYKTLKVKIGRKLVDDLETLRRLRDNIPSGVKLRFDANRAYKLQEAQRFADTAAEVLGDTVELFEQPLPPPEWTKTAILARQIELPLMLDESIESRADIRRASEAGCKLVKLKLCKQGGMRETKAMAEYANELGLGVVLGNGVATDISNLIELHLFSTEPQLFAGACEANGFTKLTRPAYFQELQLEQGAAVWQSATTADIKIEEERGYVRQS